MNRLTRLKIRYGDKTYLEGRQKLAEYMAKLGSKEGWLVVFAKRTTLTRDAQVFYQTYVDSGQTIHIVGV
jgi:Uma2 family endonuclease